MSAEMPPRIWATVNGASTRLPDGGRQLLGGWCEDPSRPRVTAFVRADIADGLLEKLKALVDEFGSSIAQYHRNGPDYTFKSGTEVFEVSVLLDREELIERARAAIARAEAG